MDGGVADTARANTKNSCEHKPLTVQNGNLSSNLAQRNLHCRVTCLTCTKQAKAEVGRSCHPVDEAHGLGLVAATERVDHRVGRHEAVSRVHG